MACRVSTGLPLPLTRVLPGNAKAPQGAAALSIPDDRTASGGFGLRRRPAGGFRRRTGHAARLAQRVFLTLHRALEMGAAFDGDRLVDDVALDTRRRGQADLEPAHPSDDPAIYHHVVGHAFALDRGAFADGQEMGANVALDGAFDLDVAGR